MTGRPAIPRTVAPRKTGYKELPILAVSRETDEIYIERTGELESFDKLPILIATEPSSIVVSANVGSVVKYLDELWDADPQWQFRMTPVIAEFYKPNRQQTRTITKRTVVAFFGFRRGKGKNLYHYPIEPDAFIGKTIHELRPGEVSRVIKLYEWAVDIRSFLKENNLTVRPTSGGIAGQLLRDERFYPDARRKVPRATNSRARDQLPGNYYRLYVKEKSSHSATYLDQKSAHHSCAMGITFPASDKLYAKGHFSDPGEKVMARFGSPRFQKLISEYGLFLVNLVSPAMPPTSFPLPCMEKPGANQAWIFSNEIPYIQASGGKITSIIAQWTSPIAEQGVNKYAEWSLAELAESDDFRRSWLKPLLLATYGILAARPKPIEFGYKRAKGGVEKRYPVGSGVVTVQAKTTANAHEMPTANVIHRGMIEAETRLRSITLAKQFTAKGMKVLAIYADSIFVDTNGQAIPLLDTRWQIKAELERLQFFSSTSFTSNLLTKLPGIPKDGMDTVRRLERMRSFNADTHTTRERHRLARNEDGSLESAKLRQAEAAAEAGRGSGSVRPSR